MVAASEVARAAADLLRSEGRGKAADLLQRQMGSRRRPTPSVLIAGEDKRGKSSLVNALLGQPDLSPIGVEVVTGAPISFFYSDPPRAAILHYGETAPVAVDFARAQQLATVQGNPQNAENIRAVQLGVAHPLLRELMLVDTPGVGGLSSGHGELTLQSLAFADALVFVMDSGAQLRAAELEFLRRASSRIDTVILVLTKIDANRGWRTIRDDNLRILKEQAPRFASCPVVPVSSVLALRALTVDDPEDAKALREESGLVKLESVLAEQVVTRSSVLADANLLRAAVGPLWVADRALREQLSALSADSTTTDDLEQEQTRLKQLGSDKADWPRRLDTQIRKITLQRSEQLSFGLSEVRRRYDARLKDPSAEDIESLPGELVADLTALAGQLNEEAAKQLTALVQDVLDDIDRSSSIKESVEKLTADHLSDQLEGLSIGDYSMTHYDRLSLMSSFSSGRSLSTLVTTGGLGIVTGVTILPGIGLAIGLGLGALYAYQAFKGRRKALFSGEFKAWMSEQCARTQTTVNTTFQRELIDVQDEMRLLVREALSEREEQIGQSLKAAKALRDSDASKRVEGRKALVTRRQKIRAMQTTISENLSELGQPQPTEPNSQRSASAG